MSAQNEIWKLLRVELNQVSAFGLRSFPQFGSCKIQFQSLRSGSTAKHFSALSLWISLSGIVRDLIKRNPWSPKAGLKSLEQSTSAFPTVGERGKEKDGERERQAG